MIISVSSKYELRALLCILIITFFLTKALLTTLIFTDLLWSTQPVIHFFSYPLSCSVIINSMFYFTDSLLMLIEVTSQSLSAQQVSKADSLKINLSIYLILILSTFSAIKWKQRSFVKKMSEITWAFPKIYLDDVLLVYALISKRT